MTNADSLLAALRGAAVLAERKKVVVKEHNERIKRLQELAELIQKQASTGEIDVNAQLSVPMSEDVRALLSNPVRGL